MQLARTRVLVLVAVAIFLLVCGAFILHRWKPQPAPRTELNDTEIRALVQRAQVAIGNLENRKFPESDAGLNAILATLPTELMAVRNLAISRLLAYEEGDLELQPLEAALGRLQEVDPDSEVTYWLIGRAHAKTQESIVDAPQKLRILNEALGAYDEAIRLSPGNPAFWWDIFEVSRYARDATVSARRDALGEAARLAPRNLFVLTELLVAQAEQQDPAIVETLNRIRELIAPIATGIQQRARADVAQLIDQALEAAGGEDWALVRRRCHPLASVIRPEEIVQSDFRRVRLNALEFVLHDFQGPLREDIRSLPQATGAEIQVQWTVAAADPELSQLDDVRDVAVVDFDLDQQSDLILLRSAAVEVYSRPEPGGGWQQQFRVPLANSPRGLLVADLDRDTHARSAPQPRIAQDDMETAAAQICFEADPEVIVFGADGVVVFENQLDQATNSRTLEPVEQPPGLARMQQVSTAALVDFDHDGDLDFVCVSADGLALWSNRDNLTFEDATSWSLLPPPGAQIQWLVAADLDRDVDTDILLGGSSMKTGYLENLRHGQLRWRSFDTAFAVLDSAAGLAVAEVDRNASWDLLAATPRGLAVARTTTSAPGVIQHLASSSVAAPAGQAITLLDYDNDGWQDALLSGELGLSLLRGGPQGEFAAAVQLTDERPARRSTAADLDADGDLDIVVLGKGRLRFLNNEGGNRNHWLTLGVRGEEEAKSGRVNHYGIGSTIEIKAGDAYQAQVVSSTSTHFGLGELERAAIARVLFTNGIPQAVIQPQADQVICEKMMLKGSCPYVYTWTGERFEFYTDLLWAAPLGLQLADGVIAPDRPSEYIKIAGDRMRARDGHYVLQVTEELWEAAYFDRILLIAIDHPEQVEVFSNEKVGPGAIAQYKIHTVRRPRPPVSARDARGRDVLDQLRQRDGTFVRPFEKTYRQGLAEEHFLELDLGQLHNPYHITLFLTGWIYPTDTSLNVALSHNPELAAPKPPAVWVPGPSGQWQEAIPYMGFPGGKTKTIAVDLSGVFPTDDYRLRIVTSAELYWDEAFFTVDEEPVALREMPLELATADLHYRGFSRARPAQPHAPQTYDYEQVVREPRWPPMQGHFTAYGDVRELLTATDARHVILAAGDELTLRFELPPEPPPGWKRDFILHNVGWDKDADLNTVYGQSVEPLPFVGMSSYPFAVGQDYPETRQHALYRKTHQTRRIPSAAFWKQILRHP